jgi:hypothetical protein
MCSDGFPIVNRYACSLLPTVLQGIKGIVNGFDYIIAGLIEGYTNNTAGIVHYAPLIIGFSHPFMTSEL